MDAAAKQQIVERVKQATNILVTVSNNPSVDQLAACIGLTLLLNKMEKHGTAVFSGKVPSTIEFLQPEKTIEANTDSLQDFIISLDKSKADKLRYKVEDQVVRIFITPYRTSLSEKDLIFSQGDVNVEVVMALGVHDRNELDAAITAHGRILHDATVISINAGAGNPPKIGQINWQDPTASSLSEMLVSISEAFGSGLIDNQMATAFLTGIVAETSRFSNNRTSPKVMTIAAQLMAAGANQQLIVSKLESPVKSPPKPLPVSRTTMKPVESDKDGALNVSHDRSKPDGAEVEVVPSEIHIDKQGNLITSDELHSSDIPPLPPPTLPPIPPPVAPPPMPPLPPPMPPEPPQAPPQPEITPPPQAAPPSLLSPAQELTPEPPLAPLPPPPPIELGMPTDIVRPQPEPHAVIPPHNMIDPMGGKPAINPPFSADMESEWIDPYNTVAMDPLASRQTGTNPMIGQAAAVAPPGQAPPPTASAGGIDSARDAVQSALAAAPFDPAFAPPVASLGAQTVSSDINNPQTIDGTPSLSLPSNTNGAIGTIPPSPPMNDMNPAAPPNLPPPLPLASNPGAMLPNAPAYQPPITTS